MCFSQICNRIAASRSYLPIDAGNRRFWCRFIDSMRTTAWYLTRNKGHIWVTEYKVSAITVQAGHFAQFDLSDSSDWKVFENTPQPIIQICPKILLRVDILFIENFKSGNAESFFKLIKSPFSEPQCANKDTVYHKFVFSAKKKSSTGKMLTSILWQWKQPHTTASNMTLV